MAVQLTDDSGFDESSIKNAISQNETLEVITHSLPPKAKDFTNLALLKYLEFLGLNSFYNKLYFCLDEIMSNAIKANMKRAYFKDKNLDINNDADYEKGMNTFRDEAFSNTEYYFRKLKEDNLYVTFSLRFDELKLIIEVRNNSIITAEEQERISNRILNFQQFPPLDLLDNNFVDQTEGAGLGINTILLALESFGLPTENYQIFVEDNETVTRLIIEDSSDLLEEI